MTVIHFYFFHSVQDRVKCSHLGVNIVWIVVCLLSDGE